MVDKGSLGTMNFGEFVNGKEKKMKTRQSRTR